MPYIAFERLRVAVNLPNAPQKGWSGAKEENDERGIVTFQVPGFPDAHLFINVELNENAATWWSSWEAFRTGFYEPTIVAPARQIFFASQHTPPKQIEVEHKVTGMKIPAMSIRGTHANRQGGPGPVRYGFAGAISKTKELHLSPTVGTQRVWSAGPSFSVVNGISVAQIRPQMSPFLFSINTQSKFYEMPGVIDVPRPELLTFPTDEAINRFSDGAIAALDKLLEGLELVF